MPSMEDLHNLDVEATVHSDKWGIDKKIPVALILVVVFQTVAITWGAATLSSDVKNYGEKIVKIERDFEKFVDKAESKFITQATHDIVKQSVSGEIANIKEDIQTLESRVRDLERNLK